MAKAKDRLGCNADRGTDRHTDVTRLTVALRKSLEEPAFCNFLQKNTLKMAVIKKLEYYLGIKEDNLRFKVMFPSLRPITVRRIRRHVATRSRTLAVMRRARGHVTWACAHPPSSPIGLPDVALSHGVRRTC